jgi:arsenate reductase
MAEELLRKLAGKDYEVESAGIEPGKLNPVVIEVLKGEGIDITGKKTKSVMELLAQRKQYDYVITVCDEASAERCPAFPGKGKKMHWGFIDPSRFEGTFEDKLRQTTAVKDEIKKKILDWLQTVNQLT